MRVIYNGIDLGVLETYAFDSEAVYDDSGVDYLYSKFSMVFRAVVNGQAQVLYGTPAAAPGGGFGQNGPAMSYTFDENILGTVRSAPPRVNPFVPVGGGVPPDFLGATADHVGVASPVPSRLRHVAPVPNAPPLTHAAVRHRLSAPRGKLWVFAGPGGEAGNHTPDDEIVPGATATLMLESPAADFRCDCKNGPAPKLLGVHAAMGDANTLLVDWACETYVNEAIDNGVSFSNAILSNRLMQTQLIDQAGWTTVATGGVVIFRTDLLYDFLSSPDRDRPVFFLPIPQGFVRENIQVAGREDVTGIEYSYQDRQVPVNFPAGPYARAASISAVHRQAILTSTDVFDGALSVYQTYMGLRANRNIANQPAGATRAVPVRPPGPTMGSPRAPFQVPPPVGGRP